jgi:hypothetical protein
MSEAITRTSTTPLLRLSGWAAIAGGVLRIADTFTTTALPQNTLMLLYFATDVLLLTGIAGVWVRQRRELGLTGTISLAVFVVGILMIRASAFGVLGYQPGAAAALIGMALYSVDALVKRSTPMWAPLLWLLSLAAGIASVAGYQPVTMFALAGIAFGFGFVVAGATVLKG